MIKDDLIGSYAIIGLSYNLNKIYTNQVLYIVVDYDLPKELYKLRPPSLSLDEIKDFYLYYDNFDGFWLRAEFVKVIGNPKTNKLVEMLYGSQLS